MKDNSIFSKHFFNENEEDNNSIFQFNEYEIFQNSDSSNYFKNIVQLNEIDEGQISDNEYNSNNYQYNNLGNKPEYKYNEFPENESCFPKSYYIRDEIKINEEEPFKIINNNEISKEEKEDILLKDGSTSNIGTEDTPLRMSDACMKNQSKEYLLNNNNIAVNNCKLFNSNIIAFTNQKINNKRLSNKKSENNVLSKKRKQRIHLEDLNIDPELIKYKKYKTIGDKVITSKNSKITELDKREIRAIRNRISAQKSRDRKKAEFLNLQMNLKFQKQQIEKQNIIIKNFEEMACPTCKSKINQIILDNNLNLGQSDSHHENEFFDLDEKSSILSDKKGLLLGKYAGGLITLVCLFGIFICISKGRFSVSYKNILIENNNQLNIRHLVSTNDIDLNSEQNNTISNITINDNDKKDLNIPINVPLPIIFNDLQLYHDKFGLDIYSFLKNKRKGKTGFLMKKLFYNESLIDNSMCIETNNIEHNNYIIDHNFKNTLPVEVNNIDIDNKISHRIISLFIKEYDTMQRYIDGRRISLEEQIEIETKNSGDGCVYLQIIIPKYKINNYGRNNTYERYDGFFEIRGKIFAYNNYYDSKVTQSF